MRRLLYVMLTLVALVVPLSACIGVPDTALATPAPALVAHTDTTVAAASFVAVLQPARPADSVLFDAMQEDLKSLAWRSTDGKFRATGRVGSAGPWESNVRDAVWKALFVTTQ